MKTAIFGGSFNPVHIGHLSIAEEVLVQRHYDRILFIPVFIPPHKPLDDPGPKIRMEMLEASIAWNPAFEASACEIERAGVSYTIDTIRHLTGTGVIEGRPGLVLGDELARGFLSWKEPDSIARESDILIVHREASGDIEFAFPHAYIQNPLIAVSSSMIRERIRGGGAWRSLVPDGARAVIEKRGLYGLR